MTATVYKEGNSFHFKGLGVSGNSPSIQLNAIHYRNRSYKNCCFDYSLLQPFGIFPLLSRSFLNTMQRSLFLGISALLLGNAVAAPKSSDEQVRLTGNSNHILRDG